MVEVVIPAGMKPWDGGDSAPADWDGGAVLCHDGVQRSYSKWPRSFYGPSKYLMPIAYTPRADAKVSERERVLHAIERNWNHGPDALADAILATLRAGGEAREAGLRAALCLSGFAGHGIFVEGFEDPAEVYGALTAALGMPDADDDDLRAALAPAVGGEGL